MSRRFQAKREAILEAATAQINQRGLKGLTLVGVAEAVDLNTTSLTYYFRRKEHLATAAFERALDRYEGAIAEAARAPEPRDRLGLYLDSVFEYAARVRAGEAHTPILFSDIRAMEEPSRSALITRYRQLIAEAATFFAPDRAPTRPIDLARAQVLLDSLHWMRAWLDRYSVADFPRVRDRLFELFTRGMAAEGRAFAPIRLSLEDAAPTRPEAEAEPAGPDGFLRAATVLMNERGYRGASVDRIAARLNVSKGSFYHHLDAKDDLVLACFDRSYARVSAAQRRAIELDGAELDWWDRLSACVAALIEAQFHSDYPLLRITALQALPPELRRGVLRRSNRMAQRFAGMIIDGVTDGSIRPVDPIIASQCVVSLINAAFDFRFWAVEQPSMEAAIADYVSPLAFGALDRPEAAARTAPTGPRPVQGAA